MTSEDPTVDMEGDAAPPLSAEQLAWIDKLISARHSTFPVGSGAGGDSSRTSPSEAGKTLFPVFPPATTRVAAAILMAALVTPGCHTWRRLRWVAIQQAV